MEKWLTIYYTWSSSTWPFKYRNTTLSSLYKLQSASTSSASSQTAIFQGNISACSSMTALNKWFNEITTSSPCLGAYVIFSAHYIRHQNSVCCDSMQWQDGYLEACRGMVAALWEMVLLGETGYKAGGCCESDLQPRWLSQKSEVLTGTAEAKDENSLKAHARPHTVCLTE